MGTFAPPRWIVEANPDRLERPVIASDSTVQRFTLADPDVRLMLEVRDDSAAAFEELMLRYQSRVVNLLEHLVGRRGQAEDLAQDVFLRVYRARKTYVPGAKFSTWLFTIVNNVAANAQRGRTRRKEVNLDNRDSGPLGGNPLAEIAQAPSGLMPARQLDKAEMREIVRMAVANLGDRQRMAVLLNKFEGLGYAEIGQTMDMSPEAVKSLLARARDNLRQVIEPYMQQGLRPDAEPVRDETG
jgi:RNA polymerase sigma-70 factor, ECF subfamily